MLRLRRWLPKLLFSSVLLTVCTLLVLSSEKIRFTSKPTNIPNLNVSSISISLAPSQTEEEPDYFTVGSYTYVDYGEDLLLIDSYTNPVDSNGNIIVKESLTLPTKIKNKKVVGVDDFAFKGVKLNKVVIPEGYTFIGKQAFYNTSLEELLLPSTVKTLSDYSFASNNLTEVRLEHINDLYLGNYVFESNQITSFSLPEKLKIIPKALFRGNNLTHFKVPSSVIAIMESAFEDNKISEMNFIKEIDTGSLKLESNSFKGNDINAVITLDEGIHYESDTFDNGVYINFK